MLAKQLFEDIAAKLSETIANSPAKDLEKNAKAMLGGAFAKMDLVTHEEFDIQQQILIKTRTKLSEVEARLAALENSLRPDAAPSADGDDDMAAPAALSDGVKSGDGNTP